MCNVFLSFFDKWEGNNALCLHKTVISRHPETVAFKEQLLISELYM